jgi:uncharacterized protein (TIGR02268 family)
VSLPAQWFILLLVALLGARAAAQPRATPGAQQARGLELACDAATRENPLYLALDVLTAVIFETDVDRGSVEFEGSEARVQIVDMGNRSILLKPVTRLGPEERLVLHVRFTDGALPERAVFALVMDMARVSRDVRVSRRPRTPTACQTELAAPRSHSGAGGPLELVLAGRMDAQGVQGSPLAVDPRASHFLELKPDQAWVNQGGDWIVVAVWVTNNGKKTWAPASATLSAQERGITLEARGVRMNVPRLAPGERGLVALELDKPLGEPGDELFELKIVGAEGGYGLRIPGVRLSQKALQRGGRP